MCQRAGDHATALAAVLEAAGVGFGCRFGPHKPMPRSINARRSTTLPSRLIDPSRRLCADSYCTGDSPDAR